ncbi:hypothetical protein QYF36_009335 [Acer negundo]|nr:hypothetical protein QYF36_009335 [Acer negundo]
MCMEASMSGISVTSSSVVRTTLTPVVASFGSLPSTSLAVSSNVSSLSALATPVVAYVSVFSLDAQL